MNEAPEADVVMEHLVSLVGPGQQVLVVGDLDSKTRDALQLNGCRLVVSGGTSQGRSGSGCDVVLLTALPGDIPAQRGRVQEGLRELTEGGRLVVVTSNAAHATSRLRALQGQVVLKPDSISTDLLVDLLADEDLAVESIHATLADPLSGDAPLDTRRLPVGVVEWLRRDPDALHDRLIACARHRRADEPTGFSGSVVALMTPESVVKEDQHTSDWLELRDARHRLLTMRDHVIGLEAKAASAQSRQGVANAQLKALKRKLNKLRTQEMEQEQPSKREGSGVLKLGRGRKGSVT